MVYNIYLKKNYRDNKPACITELEFDSPPLVGDILELYGEEYRIAERRWGKESSPRIIVEAGTGSGVVQC